jgi:hypothetical protein
MRRRHLVASPAYLLAAVVSSVLSFRWLPFCAVGWHECHSVTEVWGRRLLCLRCGKTLEVGR